MFLVIQPLFIFATLLSVSFLVYTIIYYNNSPSSRVLVLLMLSITLYTFGYAQELIQKDINGVLFWTRIQYLGISFIPGFILLLAINTYRFAMLKPFKKYTYLIFIPAFFILISQWLYPYYDKFYNDFDVEFFDGYHILIIDRGLFNWIHVTQVMLGLAISLFLYIKILVVGSRTVSRNSIVILLVGISIPSVSFFQYMFFPITNSYDPIPLAMALATPFYSYGILSSHLVSDSNIAKIKLFNHTNNAVFIFDKDKTLIDINNAAINYFDINLADILYTKIDGFQFSEEIEVLSMGEKFGEIRYRDKIFKLSSLNFSNNRGKTRGTIWSLTDISEEKRQLNSMIEREAKDNPLGIYDRTYWLRKGADTVQRVKKAEGSIQLTLIQINDSKQFIDTLGLDIYYSLFKEIIKRVKVICGDQVEIGLYNDEIMALLFYNQSLNYLEIFVEKCIRVIKLSPFFLENKEIYCSVSIGAYAPEQRVDLDLEEYINKASNALELVVKDNKRTYNIIS